jgi:hypothetical protein
LGHQDWLIRQHGGEGHPLHEDAGVVAGLDALIEGFG